MKKILSIDGGGIRGLIPAVVLAEGNDDMDDASRTNIKVLELLAENLVDRRDRDLKELCTALAA